MTSLLDRLWINTAAIAEMLDDMLHEVPPRSPVREI
jgi:hypothetical protein